MRVAILGAGITGLVAANELLKGGAEVTIFEAAPHAGGLGGTFRRGGFAFDFGPHEFVSDNPALDAILQEVAPDDVITVEKHVAQHFLGEYLRYPFGVVEVLRRLGLHLTCRAFAEVALERAKNLFRKPDDDSFEAWTRSRFGRTLYELYFGPYTKKVWGIDPSTLDPRTASQRITVDSVWDLVRRTVGNQLFGIEDRERRHSEFRHSFRYFRGGIGTLHQRVGAAVARRGGTIVLGRRLTGIEHSGGRVSGLLFADGTHARGFDHVLSTIPLPALVTATLPERAPQLLRKNRLPFRAMAFVFLRIGKPRVLDWHWIYYSGAETPFQRLTEFGHFDAGMCPAGCTGLALEVSCEVGDATWTSSDPDLVERCAGHLIALGHLRREDILGADVVRTTNAYPLQVKNFQEKTEALVDALSAECSNLVTIGRQGLFRYCNMNECMEMALDIAPQILGGAAAIRYQRSGTWLGIGVTDRPQHFEAARAAARMPAS